MKRNWFSVLCLAALLLSLCQLQVLAEESTAQAEVSVKVTKEIVGAGELFDVTLELSRPLSVSGLGLDVRYDGSALKLAAVEQYGSDSFYKEAGPLTGERKSRESLVWTAAIDSRLEGVIATLRFQVLEAAEPGTCLITVDYTTGLWEDAAPGEYNFRTDNATGRHADVLLDFSPAEIQVWNGILVSSQGEDGFYSLSFTPGGAYCAAALYSEDSQLKELHFDTVANSASVRFSSWQEGDSIRLMLLDSSFRPLCPAVTP